MACITATGADSIEVSSWLLLTLARAALSGARSTPAGLVRVTVRVKVIGLGQGQGYRSGSELGLGLGFWVRVARTGGENAK